MRAALWFDDGPVVVGMDGSHAALNAMRWAAEEALALHRCLRLVHAVVAPSEGAVPAVDEDAVLVQAARLAQASSGQLRVQTAAIVGDPCAVLLRESEEAALVCLGAEAPRLPGQRPFGVVAEALAGEAGCPVAVIRSRPDGTPQIDGVISVVLDDSPDNEDVLRVAMHEGRVRRAVVRQIDQRADSWVRRYPDVRVEIVAAGTGQQYRRDDSHSSSVGLAVVGRSDSDAAASGRVSGCHAIPNYPDCSVLMVRRRLGAALHAQLHQ
ncbi:universal stress protein [Mycolicibacterium parafortuitum]|uniref:Universal stress protein family protein [Mycobacterium tuberculosis H37Rv] n=1 Tax=Mycolicibacterium parafortuitum TaxID=39692 RepID=A0A375YN41_MYCPF|nr:universal stress protein [Mycolicibacterium parafortuitum]ORB28624.1 universal stress protein UspA [Mycolicibacterium parafortuitum]SRX82503.1 Universal stress protein family protein [Mycobacterium tuberculosis H37Rv] [Mycolicibacterium parafortuitum]